MNRLKWFLLFEVLFLLGAGLDALFTWIGITYLGAVETMVKYNPLFAVLLFTFINAVFVGLRPTWKYQLIRVPFVFYAFHAFARNLILWLTI